VLETRERDGRRVAERPMLLGVRGLGANRGPRGPPRGVAPTPSVATSASPRPGPRSTWMAGQSWASHAQAAPWEAPGKGVPPSDASSTKVVASPWVLRMVSSYASSSSHLPGLTPWRFTLSLRPPSTGSCLPAPTPGLVCPRASAPWPWAFTGRPTSSWDAPTRLATAWVKLHSEGMQPLSLQTKALGAWVNADGRTDEALAPPSQARGSVAELQPDATELRHHAGEDCLVHPW